MKQTLVLIGDFDVRTGNIPDNLERDTNFDTSGIEQSEFRIGIVTRNPQVSQDHSDPQLYCGSEWSSPILTRRIAYNKIRMRKSVFFCSRPSHEFEKTALFILSNNNMTQRNFLDKRGRLCVPIFV